MTDKSKIIAAHNDAFRSNIGHPNFIGPQIPGRYVMTSNVSNLANNLHLEIVSKIREFSDFNEDNDPHGEHDCGQFQLEQTKQDIIWKIDYYDVLYQHLSENPADLAKTRRVLTTMLSCEY